MTTCLKHIITGKYHLLSWTKFGGYLVSSTLILAQHCDIYFGDVIEVLHNISITYARAHTHINIATLLPEIQ